MSDIIAVVSRQPRFERERAVQRALLATNRGRASSRAISLGDATLGATSAEWETMHGDDLAIAIEGDLVVVADATLFYRRTLLRALSSSGVRCTANTPAQLILAAYQLWGR